MRCKLSILSLWVICMSVLGCEDITMHHAQDVEETTHHAIRDIGHIQIAPEIQYLLTNRTSSKEKIKVNLVFDSQVVVEREQFELKVEVDENRQKRVFLDNREITPNELQEFNHRRMQENVLFVQRHMQARQAIVNDVIRLIGTIPVDVRDEFKNGFEPMRIELEVAQIEKLLDHASLIGIELYEEPIDDSLATAKLATYVTQSASYQYNEEGRNVGVYMSESGCPPTGYISNYQKISGSDTNHSRLVSSLIRSVSPNSKIYCRSGCVLPTASMIGTNAGYTPPIFIANLSCSQSSGSEYDSNDMAADDLSYNTGLTIVKSAGNNGNSTGDITGPGRGLNVITVGSYDDHSFTPSQFSIESYSSYRNPTNTKNDKPELSAPGHLIDGANDSSGNPIVMSGTSFAAPHVAGMLANLNSMWSQPSYNLFTPPLARTHIMVGARDYVIGGYDKVGVGGADFYRMYTGPLAHTWKSDIPSNGIIEFKYTLPASSTKAIFIASWLNRGTWIYQHRNDPFPAGIEFGLVVYSPSGNVIATHWNPHNGFARVEFEHLESGEYKIAIVKLSKRDTALNLNMHLMLQY